MESIHRKPTPNSPNVRTLLAAKNTVVLWEEGFAKKLIRLARAQNSAQQELQSRIGPVEKTKIPRSMVIARRFPEKKPNHRYCTIVKYKNIY